MTRGVEAGRPPWVPAVACMLVAALLRWPGLGAQSLWIDEIYSVELMRRSLRDMLSVQDGHPPLYALLQVLVAYVVPDEMSGRAISAVVGVLAVGLLVVLGTKLWDRRVGTLAGLLLASSPLHVWYSQEGRMYALVVLIAIASSLALAGALRGAGATNAASGEPVLRIGGSAAWALYALLSLAGIFTHYTYAGLLLAQGAFLLLEARIPRRILVGLAVVAALAIAAIPIFGREAVSFVGERRGFEWMALPYVGFTFVGGFGLGPPIEELHRQRDLAAVLPYWPAILVVVAVALWIAVEGGRAALATGAWGRYLALWATLPLLFVFAGSWIRNGDFNVRYVLIALPAFLLIAALGLTAGSVWRLRVGTAALVALALVSIVRDRADARYAREDLRAAARFLATNTEPTDRIVVTCAYMRSGLKFYAHDLRYEALPVWQVRTPDDAATNLRELTAPARPTWLVVTREWEDDPAGVFRTAFAEAVRTAPDATFPGVRIYRFAPTALASPLR